MLLLDNDVIKGLLDPARCVAALERAYTDWARGHAAQVPEGGRMDLGCPSPGPELGRRFLWGAMAGVLPSEGIFALRQKFDIHYAAAHPDGRRTKEKFCREPGTYCGFLIVASTENAEPLAIMNDGVLQHLRVAGTAAVAAKHLARPDACTLAIIGSGGMAHAHAATISAVRPITQIRVYSPTAANRARFAEETAAELGIEVVATETPDGAVAGADVVALCTNSSLPVFADTTWVEPGMHCTNVLVTEVGALVDRADRTVLHEHGGPVAVWADGEGLAEEWPAAAIERYRDDLPTLADLLAGRAPGRAGASDVTYFHNHPGAGIQFAAMGAELYRRAVELGCGTEIPTSWFLQDVRD